MNDDRVVQIGSQSQVSDPLTELLRERAVELLQAAVNAECAEFLHRHQPMREARGRCAVVRNGFLPKRSILTGIGPLPVQVPRVRDRSGRGLRFESQLVPAYVRRGCICVGLRKPMWVRRCVRWWEKRPPICRRVSSVN